MSTFPAEIVRLGSIYTQNSVPGTKYESKETHNNGNEWILVLLVRELGGYIDTR